MSSRSKPRSKTGSRSSSRSNSKPHKRNSSKSRTKVHAVGHEKQRRRSHSKGRNIRDSCKTQENMREASENMSLTQLQSMAKKKGIAFGGLSKKQLVQKICQYS